MTNTLLDKWQSSPAADTNAVVIPDGCRDLIMRCLPGGKPDWFVSSLTNCAYDVSIDAGDIMRGFRLKPGTSIDQKRLLDSVQHRQVDFNDICCRIESFSSLSMNTAEALGCLALEGNTAASAASQLGVGLRTLQRLLIRKTGQPPTYWMLLARVRRAARAIVDKQPLAEIAYNHDYADQAHMSREFKRWLNISPSRLKLRPEILNRLNEPGYS